MAIARVTIVRGTEAPVGEGDNCPVRCLVRHHDGGLQVAIVKRLPLVGVAAEAFCALLLRGWGLTVPEPAIADLGPEIAFASLDIAYPNLKHRLGWSEELPDAAKGALVQWAGRVVASFSDTPKALSVDEAIDNRDRNLGNILWDGENVAWIDHERVLGLSTLPDRNKLADLLQISGLDYSGVQAAAIGIALSLGQSAVSDAEAECRSLPVSDFATFLATRLRPLANRVLQRFPQPDDLLLPREQA